MKKEEIKQHLRRVIRRLERVLFEMKSVVIELKDVIQQIDILTKQIAKDYGLNLNEIDQQLKNRRAHGLWKLMQKYGICQESKNIICRPPSLIISEMKENNVSVPESLINEIKLDTCKNSSIKDFKYCIWSEKLDRELDMAITKEKMDFDINALTNFQLHSEFTYEEKLESILENSDSFRDTLTSVTSDFYKADYNREVNSWQAYPLVQIDDTWDV